MKTQKEIIDFLGILFIFILHITKFQGKQEQKNTSFNECKVYLVMGVDAIDNGKVAPTVGHSSFSSIIANFVPVRQDSLKEIIDQAFFDALEFCLGHLKRLLKNMSISKNTKRK